MSIKQAIEAQPEALWLATKIEEVHRGHWCNTLEMNAATELRRQHAEIAQLTAALAALRSMPQGEPVTEPGIPASPDVRNRTTETKPVAWGMPDPETGQVYDCISPQEHEFIEGGYTIPLYATPHTEAVRMSEAWISVGDRTPTNEEETVLVADKFGNVGFGEFIDNVWDCSVGVIDGDCAGYITHWQPLPPPPVEQATAARLGVKMGDV